MFACVCVCTVFWAVHSTTRALSAAPIAANFRDYISSSKMCYSLSIFLSASPPPFSFFLSPLHLFPLHPSHPDLIVTPDSLLPVLTHNSWCAVSLTRFITVSFSVSSVVAAQSVFAIITVGLWRAAKDFCRIQPNVQCHDHWCICIFLWNTYFACLVFAGLDLPTLLCGFACFALLCGVCIPVCSARNPSD